MIVDFLLTMLFFTLTVTAAIAFVIAVVAAMTWAGPLSFFIVLLFLAIVGVSMAWYTDFKSNPFKVLLGRDK